MEILLLLSPEHHIRAFEDGRVIPIVSWLLGGLNYQIEHHLFPGISHCNYLALSRIVKPACAEYGIAYNEHASIWAGLRSHARWLKRPGNSEIVA